MTDLKQRAFYLAARALRTTSLDRRIGRSYRGVGSIFVGHSVVPDRRAYLFDQLRTDARYLERIVAHCRRSDLDIVSLDEAMQRIRQPTPRKFVCFTLDDGFKDNLTIALPIFERHDAPFTVYVTTCFLEHRIDNWWTGLAELVKRTERIEIPELSLQLKTSTLREKVTSFEYLKRAVDTGKLSRNQLTDLMNFHQISMEEVLQDDALTIDELRRLSAHPLVEIGGHTTNHPHLATLDENTARHDIASNRHWLENILDRPIRHFAYPYGKSESCGDREADLARQAGFSSAVTTRLGNIHPEHAERLHALPRLRLFNDCEHLALIDCQIHGAANALLSRGGQPVVGM